MPRFDESHVACLKRTMLPRAPECLFTKEDVLAITQETGLSPAQISCWADHFRFRVPTKDRAASLSSEVSNEQVNY